MKLCLIFSPFSSFSLVPLGISYLKSFVERNVPGVRVSNLDLSNRFYHHFSRAEFLGRLPRLCRLCPRNNTSRCDGILKGLKDGQIDPDRIAFISRGLVSRFKTKAFYDVKTYNHTLKVYNTIYLAFISCISSVLESSLRTMNDENDSILEENLFHEDLNLINAEPPDAVGFSIFSESQLNYSLALARILKKRRRPKIIFGGAYIPHLDNARLLQLFDFIDFIVFKEGELGLAGLLKEMKTGRFDRVPNLCHRKSGRAVLNRESAVSRLDQIPPPDFSDYDLGGYFSPKPSISTLFSRGCSWSACTYCAHHKTYTNPCRYRSMPDLIKELRRYRKMGIRHISFVDETISSEHLNLISQAVIKEKLKMCFAIYARPTKDFTDEILAHMYQAGFRFINWGVESFSQRILNLMCKGTRVEDVQGVLKRAHRAGLLNFIYLIHKFPSQTEEEMLEDIEYLAKYSRYIFQAAIHDFWLERDTPIFRNLKRFGIRSFEPIPLLTTAKGRLLSPKVSPVYEDPIDFKRVDKRIASKKKRMRLGRLFEAKKGAFSFGMFYTKEHLLMHIGHGRA